MRVKLLAQAGLKSSSPPCTLAYQSSRPGSCPSSSSSSSSSSITRFSASLASTGGILLTEILELTQLALDFLLHVQGLLALALPALVARHDQLPDLLAEPPVA